MKMRSAQKVHYDSGPNMTPLVDIVMVILIFLMLTGTFAMGTHYLRANLPPTAESKSSVDEKGLGDVRINIYVEPSASDSIFCRIGNASLTSQENLSKALAGLREQFVTQQKKKIDQIQVIIYPHRAANYQSLMTVFSAAADAKLTKVAFGTSH